MKISAILCTCNRSESLAKALESLAASVVPDSIQWEVLVVDNNSSDQTPRVVDEYCNRYPGRFRYLSEPRPGKSYALNSGIREAQGDVLVFTDDDVIVDPNWLYNLGSCLANTQWSGASGRTYPEKGFAPPNWLPPDRRYSAPPFALFDLGSEACELTEAPFGNNMAYRKFVFEKHGMFRTDLGPRFGSKGPQKSEDSEFGTRLLASGERFCYEPSAVLYHAVPENRVRKDYFLFWWYDKARADIRAEGIRRTAKIGGIPLYLFRRFIAWTLRWMFTLNPGRRFEAKIKVWAKVGEIYESYLLYFEKPQNTSL